MTDLEKKVFNAVLDITFYESSALVGEISEKTNLSINSVKGVIGSLVKKNKIECESDVRNNTVYNELFPVVGGKPVGYGCDEFSESEWKEFYIE